MNRSYFALFVALLIHFLLLFLFLFLGSMKHDIRKSVEPKEKKIKISLKEMPKKDKEPIPPKEQPKLLDEKIPEMPHGKQLKEIVEQPKSESIKKELIKFEPKEIEKKPQIAEMPTTEPTPIKESPPKKEAYIRAESKKPKDPLAWMNEDRSAEASQQQKSVQKSGSSINSSIKELYGEEFSKLTAGQQKYIIDNQEVMRRITQEVLTRVARVNIPREFNANRVNTIEFYLHPNGDMSDFKFLKNSGFYILDDTTKETIEYAYSRYPRPTEKILIRYNVYYNLSR